MQKEAGERDRKGRWHGELPEGPVALGAGGVDGGIYEDAGDRSVSRCSRCRGSCLVLPEVRWAREAVWTSGGDVPCSAWSPGERVGLGLGLFLVRPPALQ